jgi:hypothetical protein
MSWLNGINIDKGKEKTCEIYGNSGYWDGSLIEGTLYTPGDVQDVLTKELCNKTHECTPFKITQLDNPNFDMLIFCGKVDCEESPMAC